MLVAGHVMTADEIDHILDAIVGQLYPPERTTVMTLPPNTYGVRCEFNPGGTRYTYLVDEPHHGEILVGHHVVVASPKGGYKVIHVVDHTKDLSPVDLKYMKYIVQKVETDVYNTLMNNLTGGPDSKVYPTGVATSPLIDEGDGASHKYSQDGGD